MFSSALAYSIIRILSVSPSIFPHFFNIPLLTNGHGYGMVISKSGLLSFASFDLRTQSALGHAKLSNHIHSHKHTHAHTRTHTLSLSHTKHTHTRTGEDFFCVPLKFNSQTVSLSSMRALAYLFLRHVSVPVFLQQS